VLDKPVVDYLRQQYDLGKPPKWKEKEKGLWEPNFEKPFPKSRRLSGAKIPQGPLGWVSITISPEGQPRLKNVADGMRKIAGQGIVPMGQFASVVDFKVASKQQSEGPERRPEPADVVWMFGPDHPPKPGDKFQSAAFTDGETFFVSLQGLDFDTEAYGVLLKADNPNMTGLENERIVRAEVLEVQKEVNGVLLVRCKLVQILPKRN
jgi:hypothetical protein